MSALKMLQTYRQKSEFILIFKMTALAQRASYWKERSVSFPKAWGETSLKAFTVLILECQVQYAVQESVFWPGMSSQIKGYIRQSEVCARLKVKSPEREPMQPHDMAPQPWAKVGLDLFSIEQHNFLITVYYWSNFWEVDALKIYKRIISY